MCEQAQNAREQAGANDIDQARCRVDPPAARSQGQPQLKVTGVDRLLQRVPDGSRLSEGIGFLEAGAGASTA